MTMQTTTRMADIRSANGDGRAFCVRYEYSGYNGANASGRSSKFWCYERPSQGAPVQVRYGKIGPSGQVRNRGIDLWDARERADKKEAKGYTLTSMEVEPAPPPRPIQEWVAKPPISEWAATMPAPFNTITHIDSDGFAVDSRGRLVCQMDLKEATRIRTSYDMCG